MDRSSRERLDEINAQISEAREDAQALWDRFEAARRPLLIAGAELDSTSLEAIQAVSEEYNSAADRLDELERGRQVLFGEMAGGARTATAGAVAGKPGSWLTHAIGQVKSQHPHLAAMGGTR